MVSCVFNSTRMYNNYITVVIPACRLLCEVSNVKTGLTAQGKHLQFSRVAFGFHGNWFVAGDHHGNIYHFDLIKNRSAN